MQKIRRVSVLLVSNFFFNYFFFFVNNGRNFPLEISEQFKSFELSVFKAFNRISQIFKFNTCRAGLPGKFSATPGKNTLGFLNIFFKPVLAYEKVNHLTFFDCRANYSAKILFSLNIKTLLIQSSFCSFYRCTWNQKKNSSLHHRKEFLLNIYVSKVLSPLPLCKIFLKLISNDYFAWLSCAKKKGKQNCQVDVFPVNMQNDNKLKISSFVSVIQKDDWLLPGFWS